MKKILCPSMMCADFTELKQEVAQLEQAGIDMFHMDIMDGNFVPNMALGVEDYKAIRSLTKLPMDAHLMAQDPGRYVPIFKKAGANRLYIHPEADQIPTATLKTIRDAGMEPAIAINPGTTVASIEPLLNLVDAVLVMTVNPGFGGQKFLQSTVSKIAELDAIKKEKGYDFDIEVDGGVNDQTVVDCAKAGATVAVAGSYVFNADDPAARIKALKDATK